MGTNNGTIPNLDQFEYLYEYNNSDRYERNKGIFASKWNFRFLFDRIFFNLNIKGNI